MTLQSNDLLSGHEEADREIRLSPAIFEDFAVLATLFEALHIYNVSLNERFALAAEWRQTLLEHFQQTYASDHMLWLLAWLGDKAVGLLILEEHLGAPLFLHRQYIELSALYVTPDLHGSGLATRMMHEAVAWATQRGESGMLLYVTSQNERARAFYRRCGWHPIQEIWRLDLMPQVSRSAQD